MAFKLIAGIAAIALFVAYYGAVVVKLKDVPLALAVLGALALAAADLIETLRNDRQ